MGVQHGKQCTTIFQRLRNEQKFTANSMLANSLISNEEVPTVFAELSIVNPLRPDSEAPPMMVYRQKNVLYQSDTAALISVVQNKKQALPSILQYKPYYKACKNIRQRCQIPKYCKRLSSPGHWG